VPPDYKTLHCNHDPANLPFPPQLTFTPIVTAGMTLWGDPSSPGFADFAAGITNGQDNSIEQWVGSPVLNASGITGSDGSTDLESHLLAGQTGFGGVDLAGYTINAIGLRVDQFMIESPGENPNGDGIWTDWSIQGAYVVQGRIASTDACKKGGWNLLHGPGGSAFSDQGQCIEFVNTGELDDD